jgi:protein NirF
MRRGWHITGKALPALLFWLFNMSCQRASFMQGAHLLAIGREGQLHFLDIDAGKIIKTITPEANLRHAAISFDPRLRFAYLTARDGKLLRINLSSLAIDATIAAGSNAIGQAVAADGSAIAVSSYKPGQVVLVDPETFSIKQTIPAVLVDGSQSRVTGLVDAPGGRFICSLMDGSEAMLLEPDAGKSGAYTTNLIKLAAAGPFDALISRNGRHYIAGHQDGSFSVLDLEDLSLKAIKPPQAGPEAPSKMMHLESWADNGRTMLLPVPGQKRLLVLDSKTFAIKKTIELPAHSVYTINRPYSTETYITFAGDGFDDRIMVVNQEDGQLRGWINDAGKKIYHLTFTPRGDRALVASNETNEINIIDTTNRTIVKRISVKSPAGLFGIWRAFEGGL